MILQTFTTYKYSRYLNSFRLDLILPTSISDHRITTVLNQSIRTAGPPKPSNRFSAHHASILPPSTPHPITGEKYASSEGTLCWPTYGARIQQTLLRRSPFFGLKRKRCGLPFTGFRWPFVGICFSLCLWIVLIHYHPSFPRLLKSIALLDCIYNTSR